MARSDFNLVPINHHFRSTAPTVTKHFPIEGGDDPIDDAFLLIQVYGASNDNHKIIINDEQLPSFDIPRDANWQTWMDAIPPGILKHGSNTIRIDRIGADSFHVRNVVIHWREP